MTKLYRFICRGQACLFLAILMTGCGTKHKGPVAPYPTIDRLLSDGWTAYKTGDYETAIAKFDSVIDIKADESEAHIGAGWSRFRLGKLKEGRANFALAMTIGGPKKPTKSVLKEDSYTYIDTIVDTLGDTSFVWVIKPLHTPILGLFDLTIVSNPRGNADELLTPTMEILYSIKSFNDSTITVEWDEGNPTGDVVVKYIMKPDTLDTLVETLHTPFPPELIDELQVNYTYLYAEGTDAQIDGYCGDVAVSCANQEYLSAIINGNAVIKMAPTYKFEHDTIITARLTHITLAQCYYNMKLFDNALREVLVLAPDWKPDQDSDTFLFELLRKIESLLD